MLESLNLSLRRGGHSRSQTPSSSALSLYSPITAEAFDNSSPTPSSDIEHGQPSADMLTAVQRHASAWPRRPCLSRFLADFTLGFADGLTVPFALTAGLSSLGQTDTVIYAGMAEICAGSISMGIGGYLSAKGEEGREAVAAGAAGAATATATVAGAEDEKAGGGGVVDEYLAPLDLPPELLGMVQAHVSGRADVAASLSRKLQPEEDADAGDEETPPSSVMVGLSVALGYLIGGSLPLFPYLVVHHVGDGLMWSFIVCVIALFSFGFTKDFVLHREKQDSEIWVKEKDIGRQTSRWSDIRRSSWEGMQMVMLGSMAALAAVLCVRLFESMGQHEHGQHP